MLTDKDVYVVIKLTNGEQVMAVLEEEDDKYVQLSSPMTIRTTPIVGEGREHITAHPYCQFTDDTSFSIEKKNVMFIKRLHEMMIPHYRRIVAQHSNDWRIEKPKQQEEPFISSREAKKRIAMLVGIAGEEEAEEDTSMPCTYIDGNDTIH